MVMTEHTIAAMAVMRGVGEMQERVRISCSEVARPLLFGLGIIIAVYLPLLALAGMEGKMFRPMALTVVYALFGSMILSFTLIPVLLSFVLSEETKDTEPMVVRLLSGPYKKILGLALSQPKLVVASAMVPLALAAVLAMNLGAVFLPELDEGSLAIQAIRIPSVSLPNSVKTATLIEKAVKEFPEIDSIVSKTGRPALATDPMGVEVSDIVVSLTPRSQWKVDTKEELVEKVRERLQSIPGINFSFSQPIELRVEELISGSRSDIALQIFGEDLDELARVGQKVAERLKKLEGARDVALERINGVPYLNLTINRTATSRYGIPANEILDVIGLGMGRLPLSTVIEGERIFPVVARLPDRYMDSQENLKTLLLKSPTSGYVPMSELLNFEIADGLAQVNRVNGQRRATVGINFEGDDLVGFVKKAQEATKEVLPGGYVTHWGGEFENFERATARLIILVPIVMGGILFLLWLDMRRIAPAIVIYLNIPFAAVGGVFALAMRGLPFSISAGVGFLTLFGVAVLNGLVLMSAVKKQSGKDQPWNDVLFHAAASRLRPVLMTALVAALGFLPMALSTGAGAEVQKPLATVVIGGLVTSTLLTLLVLPSVMKLFLSREQKEDNL